MFCEGRDGQRNAFCELIDHGDATFTMTVKAQDAGLHKLHVQYDEVDVPGTARGAVRHGGYPNTARGSKVTPLRHRGQGHPSTAQWSKVTPVRGEGHPSTARRGGYPLPKCQSYAIYTVADPRGGGLGGVRGVTPPGCFSFFLLVSM